MCAGDDGPPAEKKIKTDDDHSSSGRGLCSLKYIRVHLVLCFCTISWSYFVMNLNISSMILFLIKRTSNYRFKKVVGLASQKITMFYQ